MELLFFGANLKKLLWPYQVLCAIAQLLRCSNDTNQKLTILGVKVAQKVVNVGL